MFCRVNQQRRCREGFFVAASLHCLCVKRPFGSSRPPSLSLSPSLHCLSVWSLVSSGPRTLLQHHWNLSLLHYFCGSSLCSISLPPVYSPSRPPSLPSSTLSAHDIDLHSAHTAEPPVALQCAHLSPLRCICECECGEKKLLSTPFLAQHLCSLSSGQKIFFKKAVHGGKQRGSTLAGPTLSAHFFECLFYFILFRPVNFKTVHHSHRGLRRWWHSLATHLSVIWSNLIYSASVSSLSLPALCFKNCPKFHFSHLHFFFAFSLVRQPNEHEMLIWLRLIIVISTRQTAFLALSHQSYCFFMMARVIWATKITIPTIVWLTRFNCWNKRPEKVRGDEGVRRRVCSFRPQSRARTSAPSTSADQRQLRQLTAQLIPFCAPKGELQRRRAT